MYNPTDQIVEAYRGQCTNKLDAGMWRYHANLMDARRSQFDRVHLGPVVWTPLKVK